MNGIYFWVKIGLFFVEIWIKWLNLWMEISRKILFPRKIGNPQKILIYKVGNVGDIICAVPSFIAARKYFPEAKIVLLTSPGKKGALGAKELLSDFRHIDELKVYFSEEIDSFKKKKDFVEKLRRERYDLFIQLPDDLVNFRTLLRNIIFAKLIGAKSAYGFKIRTVQLFKKIQVDYTAQKTEVESLLDLLKENGVRTEKVEYDFNVSAEQKSKIERTLKKKWPRFTSKKPLVAVSPGGKRKTNRWPAERFIELSKYINDKYGAKIVVIGGKDDVKTAKIIESVVGDKNVLTAAGELDFLGSFELLKHCSFLISNSTGAIHLAAAAGVPTIGLYTIRDVFGRWFPYGKNHKILCHKFLNCDYRKEECVEKSVEAISVDEAKNVCDEFMEKTRKYAA